MARIWPASAPRALTRERIRFGFVFQQAALFDSMTVAQNVAFPLRQHTRKGMAEIDEIVTARLAEVGLPEKNVQFKKPAELSGAFASGSAWPVPWPWTRR